MAEEPTVNNCTGLQDEQRVVARVIRQTGPIFHYCLIDMTPLDRKFPDKRRGEKCRQIGRLRGELDIYLCRFQAGLKKRVQLSFE